MSAARKKTQKPALSMGVETLLEENQELERQLRERERINKIKEERREREYRLKYLSLINCIADPVFIFDAISYKFLHWNEAAFESYGYTQEEILSMTPFDLHKPEEFEKAREHIDVSTRGTFKTFTHLTKDRREHIVEISAHDIYFDGKPAWINVVHDITERTLMEEELLQYRAHLEEMVNERTLEMLLANKKLKQEILERQKAEQAILESEKKFRDLIEKSRDGVMLVDEKGSVIEWNSGQEIIYGSKRAMVVGKKIWDVQFQHEPNYKRNRENFERIKNLWENFFKNGINPFKDDLQQSKIERPDGKLRDIQQLYFTIDTDSGVMMACTTRDITDQLVLEIQLIQTQKMEAVGTLAGGIAHDFNNILGGIIGYTDLALRKTGNDSPIRRYLDQVLTASRRASDLVKQILTFSRTDNKEKEPIRLHPLVKETLKLLQPTLSENIEIISRIAAKDSFVLADSTQIHQVIMNLCTNAAHAMRKKGGIIEVKLTEEMIEDGIYKELKAGPHLRLTVSDTGHGIKPELMDKIFDPFFTTKAPGEGTGLGLAVVHGIVKGHKGHISVYSKEGEGTTFLILIPTVVNVIHKPEKPGEQVRGGKERILLAEDDPYLVEAEKKMLEELGYQVTAVSTGVEAFEIFRKIPDRFDIIITDYAMPKMTGIQLIRQIRSIKPGIPAIICTGYQKLVSQQKTAALDPVEVIIKPIELSYIAAAIRRLLDNFTQCSPIATAC